MTEKQIIGVVESLDGFRAYLKVGVQTLYFTDRETIEEAEWYAERVKTALIHMGSGLLDFAALNYNPVVSDNQEDIVWFEDESAGYPSEYVANHWLNSEPDAQGSDTTPVESKGEPLKQNTPEKVSAEEVIKGLKKVLDVSELSASAVYRINQAIDYLNQFK